MQHVNSIQLLLFGGEAKVVFLTFLCPDDYWKHIQSLYLSLSSIDFAACLQVRGAECNEYKQPVLQNNVT